MTLDSFLTDERTLKFSRKALALAGLAVSGLAVIGLGFGFYQRMQVGKAEEQAKANVAAITDATKTITEAQSVQKRSVPTGLKVISQFQTAVEALGKEHGVTIGEFVATSETTPYLTKFNKDTKAEGWVQVSVRLSLEGSTHDILRMLRAFSTTEIPFEFNGVDLSRNSIDNDGNAEMQAKVELRVLMRPEATA